MISNQMILSFLKRHGINIIIWTGGFLVIFLIGHFSDPEPDFIEEHGIITWRTIYSLSVIFFCYGLSSKKPFWKELTEDVEVRVETCEERLNALDTDIEKIVTFADKKFHKSRETESSLSLRIKELEEKVKTLSALKTNVNKTQSTAKKRRPVKKAKLR